MRRLFNPFILLLTLIVASSFFYTSTRLATEAGEALLLAIPFLGVWLTPVFSGMMRSSKDRRPGELHVLYFGYLCMGFTSFLVIFTILRDLLLAVASAMNWQEAALALHERKLWVIGLACLCFAWGIINAMRGPSLRTVEIPLRGLPKSFDGLRIVQISDLHVGPTIGHDYVNKVVDQALALKPDLIVLTGDIVDGRVHELASRAAPLARLEAREGVYFITGNHEYYAGANEWIAHFRSLGFRVLLNEHTVLERGKDRLMVAGVVDPAARIYGPEHGPDAARAVQVASRAGGMPPAESFDPERPPLRLLLAHNPKLAPMAEEAGFDLMLSGHTHAGQFFPWTLIAHAVHKPHFAGLSQRGKMMVYVSVGTGSWGPPIRFGTSPELSLLVLAQRPTIC